MATPTVTANMSTIWDCESVTGAVGNKPVLDSEIIKENANSVGFTSTTNKYAAYNGTIPNSGDLKNQHLRAYHTGITFPNMVSYASGGLRFYVTDGANTAYWNIAGNDTWQGGWINSLVFVDASANGADVGAGTVNCSAITELGFVRIDNTTPKNLTNTWVDYFRYGDGLIATGGTPADPITMEGLYQDDIANGYGIVDKVNGVFFVYGEIQIGASAVTTNFSMDGDIVVFADAKVNQGLYRINVTGSACNASLNNAIIQSAGTGNATRAALTVDAVVSSFAMNGCFVDRAAEIVFEKGHSITGCTFNDCGQIDPNEATFSDNTISNYATTTAAALLWPTSSNITGTTFESNTRAVEINSSSESSPTFTSLVFTTNTYDVNNTSGASVVVAQTQSNASSWTGASTTFETAITLGFVVKDADGSAISSALAFIDDSGSTAPFVMNTLTNVSGVAETAYTGGALAGAIWRVRKYGYKPYRAVVDVGAESISLPVTLVTDPQQT